MNFKLKNIIKEPKSTTVGLSILIACFVLPVVSDGLTFKEMLPVLAMVVPFLLWGGPKPPDGGIGGSKPSQTGKVLSLGLVFLLVACDPISNNHRDKKLAQTQQRIDSLYTEVKHLDSLYTTLECREELIRYHHNNQKQHYEKHHFDTLPSLEQLLSKSSTE